MISFYWWHRRAEEKEAARLLRLRLIAERTLGSLIRVESWGMPPITKDDVQALARDYLRRTERKEQL